VSRLRLAAARWALLFASIFAITLPFDYALLPDTGAAVRPLSEPMARWSGESLLGIDRDFVARIVSDSTGMYLHAMNVAIIAALACIAWLAFERRRPDPARTLDLLRAGASLYLALQLFRYGLDKLFKEQFYLPEPNTAFTPLGHLSRDILYWSTIGSSHAYTVATGAIEIVVAVLLLVRRTRLLGAIGAVVVMLHIVLVNFGFDISVKLFSLLLLFLSLIVASPAIVALVRTLVLRRPVDVDASPARPPHRYAVAASTLIAAIILAESLAPYLSVDALDDDRAARPPMHGAYEVTSIVRNGDTVAERTSPEFQRIFIHRRGYLITQRGDDEMRDYRITHDSASARLYLTANRQPASVLDYARRAEDSVVVFTGIIEGDSLAIVTRQIDLEALPLYRRGWHWTSDEYR
jgi:uncharacterized membrane protein YphA (DoxX/SURF4 family)